MTNLRKLPVPDRFGNYWLGERTKVVGHDEEGKNLYELTPAIFPAKAHGAPKGTYIASRGEGGMLWQNTDAGPRLRYFKTAYDALVALQDVMYHECGR